MPAHLARVHRRRRPRIHCPRRVIPESAAVSVCAPQRATEKLHKVSRAPFVLATDPTIGMVRNGSAPPVLDVWMKSSMLSPPVTGAA